MKLFRFRTKVEFVGTIFIVAILLTTAVFSVRIITDSNDNIETFIRCSNGNYYTVTTSNLQVAIWSQNSTGGEVKIGGDLCVTSAIHLVNNTILDFQGHTMNLTGSAGFHMIQLGDGTNWVTNIEIKNGIFKGNRTNQAGLYHCIFAQDKCTHINIHDNVFTGWYGKGVFIEGGVVPDRCADISFCNNVLGDFQQGVDADGIDLDQTDRAVIIGNTIEDPGDEGIDTGSVDDVDIIGNVVRNGLNGIELYATKGTVVGNSIDNPSNYGIVLDRCFATTVSGNYIYSTGYHGIRMVGAYGCSVTSNTLWRTCDSANNTYDAIHLCSVDGVHCTYNTISSNTIITETVANKPKIMINESDSNQDYNTIKGNTLRGFATAGINKSGIHSVVKDNLGYNYSYPNHFGSTTDFVDINETGFLTFHGDARTSNSLYG